MLVRGLPGSGKSHLAHALEAELGARAVVLDPDAVDMRGDEFRVFSKRQTAEGVSKNLHQYRWLRAHAYEAIEARKVVIWNQAFTNLNIFRKMIDRLETHAREHGLELPVLVVEVETDRETAYRRVIERADRGGHDVTDEAFERFFVDYKSFADEGFAVVRTDGTDDVRQSVAAVMDALRQL